MLKYMLSCKTGDDVYKEDPTVTRLERLTAKMCGKDDALFCASGTMSNQLAIRALLKSPPYSVVMDAKSHINTYEQCGVAFHTGAQTIAIRTESSLSKELIEKYANLIHDDHFAPTELIVLENTLNGDIMPLSEIRSIAKLGLPLHLDGARLWNALMHKNNQFSLQEWCDPFASISLCFSKGLGAPVGSILVGFKHFNFKGPVV